MSIFLLLFLPLAHAWTGISDCGLYEVRAIARSTPKGLVMVVNEQSQSQFTIILPITNEATLAPYIDKPLTASVLFEKKYSTASTLGIVQKIEDRIPNPLLPLDTGLKLMTKGRCKK